MARARERGADPRGRRTVAVAAVLAAVTSTSLGCEPTRDATAQDAPAPQRARAPAPPPVDDATWGHVEVVRPGQPVIEGKSLRVDAEHVAAIANAQAGAFRHRYGDPATLAELVRDVAHDRLLADEARRRGIARRPDVVHQIDELLARELLRDRLASIDRQVVDEATLRAWYTTNLRIYTRPPQVRARLLGVADPAEARRLRARAQSMSIERFTTLVRREGEGRSRRRGGDTGWFDVDAGTVDAAVIRACFAGAGIGLLPGVVKGDDGLWYLVYVAEREGAEVRPFERVMRSVESHWRAEQRARARESLVAGLASRRSVTMHSVDGVLRYVGGPPRDAGVPAAAADGATVPAPPTPDDDPESDDEAESP
ncbi:MAG: peptidyl-prolyl cis-trans isomerase [Deltaproteobacteria bacterium]|nr:peptidyl-prolyl cis-trans isomerase [Deltaproteobacteria bacterium]